MAQQAGFQPRVPPPPYTGIPGLDAWLGQVTYALNALPRVSWFSGTTPNSSVTGTAGDIAINLCSASTSTRAWILGGAPSTVTNIGWLTIRIGPP